MPSPNLQPLPEKPQAPAAAYRLMAEILGDDYFLTPAPPAPETVNLLVAGMDGVPTQWVIRRTLLDPVVARLRASGRCRSAHPVPNLGMR